jgi:hypothetical protein
LRPGGAGCELDLLIGADDRPIARFRAKAEQTSADGIIRRLPGAHKAR